RRGRTTGPQDHRTTSRPHDLGLVVSSSRGLVIPLFGAFSLAFPFSLALGVEVLFEVLGGYFALNALGRDFDVGGPENGVEHQLAEIVVAPVLVEMAAGETEAAAAIGALAGPRHVLRFAAFDGFTHGRIATMRAFGAVHGAFGRYRGEDGSDAFHAFAEAAVEIPLILDC